MKQEHHQKDFIEIFDTTLRDGSQGEGISFSVHDKLALSETLDELGLNFIEAGNPASNPKDGEFFKRAKTLKLKTAKLCAFGSTRKKGIAAQDDPALKALLDAETEYVVFFGKSSASQVKEVLRSSFEENLDMIAETCDFFVKEGRKIIFDAEHFFDGWKEDPQYALKTIATALEAGAGRIVLCDTNGGSFPEHIENGVKAAGLLPAIKKSGALIGIHAHNDMGLAIACSISAVNAGASHVQGTLLGFGERCGNTPLAALLPTLEIKMQKCCLPAGRLSMLCTLSRRASEIANINVSDDMPYIGTHAFSHKAGMHADAVLKSRSSFEHIDPDLVGAERRLLLSEQGGRSAIAARLSALGIELKKDAPHINELFHKIKELEAQGWQFEGAEASFEILVRKVLGNYKSRFSILTYRVTSEHRLDDSVKEPCYAWVKVLVDDRTELAAAEGDGPVNALDAALRRALSTFFPELETMRLSDYKVRVIDGKDSTAAKVRVLIESTDGISEWTTVGVSTDIIEASRAALVDSIEYKLR